MENATKVSIVTKHTIQIQPKQNQSSTKLIHLTPFDLKMLSVQYIQKGLLLHKPQTQSAPSIISNLLSSFSLAIDRFYPLAGRLLTTRPDNESIFISIHCNHKGTDFIHANASHVKVSDIITPDNNYTIPPIVRSFFPLNGLFGHEGHDEPLLGVQVTELLDGIFIACSLNHCVGDGNTFWQFFNTWSRICRNDGDIEKFGVPLEFDRWFPDSVPPPVCFPLKKYQEIKKFDVPYVPECFFRFSSTGVKKLKAKANEEMSTSNISSLQALVAHMWKLVTRARVAGAQELEEECFCHFLAAFRTKIDPPLPESYVGNSVIQGSANASTWDIQGKCLGFTASILNRAMNSTNWARVHEAFELESKDMSMTFISVGKRTHGHVYISSSPRFDVYGNDFGWGKPISVRSGPGNKLEGKITVYPSLEDGGVDLEIGLLENVMQALLEDEEFMEYVV